MDNERQIMLALNCLTLLGDFANNIVKGGREGRTKMYLTNARDQFNRLLESYDLAGSSSPAARDKVIDECVEALLKVGIKPNDYNGGIIIYQLNKLKTNQ